MNDFTKEELKILYANLEYSDDDPYPTIDAMLEKLQSLINNYCEHDPVGDWHVCVDKCSKCGVIIHE